ncbi:MAG: response regulator [Thermoplasmatota archaeon]
MSEPPNVLVVDDEPEVRALLAQLLTRRSGYHPKVAEAASAEEALRLLAATDFALIVSDFRMPGKSGIDVLEAAFAQQPKARRVLITAFGSDDVALDAVLRGRIDALVHKPFSSERFLRLADSLLAASDVQMPKA